MAVSSRWPKPLGWACSQASVARSRALGVSTGWAPGTAAIASPG